MPDDQRLSSEYDDILDGHVDRDLLGLVGDLDRMSASITPPQGVTMATARALREAAHRRPRRRSLGLSLPGLPAGRLGTALAGLLAVLLLSGVGYAAITGLDALYGEHTGTQPIVTERLGREVSISRRAHGFTVTVRRIYADPNRIVIGYTIAGPPGRAFNNIIGWGDFDDTPGREVARSPILTDRNGREFAGGIGGDQGGGGTGSNPFLATYDSAGIGPDASEIGVRLRIGELTAYERIGEGEFRDVSVDGPFVFDLTIPVERGRVAEPGRSVESGGKRVTLHRVVTARTGTRVSLSGAGPHADVRLHVGGTTYRLRPPDELVPSPEWSADQRFEYVIGESLLGARGEWTLTVRPGPTPADPSATRLEGGPWVFRFAMP